MADTKNNHADKQQPEKAENPRKAIREARERRLRVIDGPSKTVKVFAANEAMRSVLRHANGTRFRDKLDQGVEWPNDSFTKRRLAEGSVRTEPSSGGEPAPVDDTLNPREQAEAMKPPPQEPPPQEPARASREKPEGGERARPQPQPQPQPQPATT